MPAKRTLFRVTFSQYDSVYQIYASKVHESDMFGFVVVEDFMFGETTSLVVDPSEERLKMEFSEVKRAYIPMTSIIRIDEVEKPGVAKVLEKTKDSKVAIFPHHRRSE